MYCRCSDQRYYVDEEDDDVFDHDDDEVEDDDEDDDDIVCLVSAVGYTEVTSQARVLSEYSLSAQRIMIIMIMIMIMKIIIQKRTRPDSYCTLLDDKIWIIDGVLGVHNNQPFIAFDWANTNLPIADNIILTWLLNCAI